MIKTQTMLLFVLLAALGLRALLLTEIPPGLNRDEAAIGYTAYSLLKTGRDEHGVSWPLSLKSFGDWKLPVYVYATIPAVAIIGLNDYAVRLPSVIAGTLTVLLTYLIVTELFKRRELGLSAAAVLAISPWHIFFSRVASEANLAVFLVAVAFFILLKSEKQRWLAVVSTLILTATLLTYHGNHVFTPLIFLVWIFHFRKTFLRGRLGYLSISAFLLAALAVYYLTLFSADKTKISGLAVVNDQSLVHENIDKNRSIVQSPIIAQIFYNKGAFFLERTIQSYLKSFSPEFLFIRGGGNAQHNIPDFGNLYLVEAPFLLLGLYFLFARREKSASLLLSWMLIAPLGAVLTKDAPHSARMFAILPVPQIVIAYGVVNLVGKMKILRVKQLLAGVIIMGYILSMSIFLVRYFILFPYKRYSAWGAPMRETVEKLQRLQKGYKEVVVARPDYSLYIYYLFYTHADPAKAQKELVRYPPTSEGFEHIKSFAGVNFKKINWAEELLLPDRLYVDWVEGVPSGATQSAVLITKDEVARLGEVGFTTEAKIGDWVTSQLVDAIRLPDGSPYIYFIETRIGTPSAVLEFRRE